MGLKHRYRQLGKGKIRADEWVKPLLDDAEKKKLILVVSSIAIAETCRIDGKDVAIADEVVRDFFDREYIALYAADRAISEIARDIRCKHEIDGADSIHLATAVFAGVSIILTNDGDSKRQRNKKKNPTPLLPLDKLLTSGGQPLRILTPKAFDEMRRLEVNPLMNRGE